MFLENFFLHMYFAVNKNPKKGTQTYIIDQFWFSFSIGGYFCSPNIPPRV